MNILYFSLVGMVVGFDNELMFSFRSQYDGYIMPYWKNKELFRVEKFFEDAVVVTPTTIVLGDGVGGALGWSGVYSNFQCLKLTNLLLDSTEVDTKEIMKKVGGQVILNNFDLNVLASFRKITINIPTKESEETLEAYGLNFFKLKAKPDIKKADEEAYEEAYKKAYEEAYEKAYNKAYDKIKEKVEKSGSDITEESKDTGLFKTKEDFSKLLSIFVNPSTRFHASTTLVYLKLEGDKLMTGVAGDSSYLIFRFDSEEHRMKLVYVSPETVQGFNSPHSVHETGISGSKAEVHQVQEGDVVLAASDGVLDVLPISFLTAATNFLVHKMVEAQRNNNPDIDFDYRFDLAGFMESYVNNLARLTLDLKDVLYREKFADELKAEKAKAQEIEEAKAKTDKKNAPILPILGSVGFILNGNSDVLKSGASFLKSNENPSNEKPSYEKPSYKKPSNEDIEATIKLIYKEEICNTFDPTYDNRAFKAIVTDTDDEDNKRDLTDFEKDIKKDLASIKCSEKKDSVMKIDFGFDANNAWNCDSLDKLNGKEHTLKDGFYSFDECVFSSTPELQDGITEKEIANSFNSRYFARNIGLASKFMSSDKREKIDEFTRKEFESKGKPFYEEKYLAKRDDIGIAAASLISKKRFDEINLFNIPEGSRIKQKKDFLKQKLNTHAEALKDLLVPKRKCI